MEGKWFPEHKIGFQIAESRKKLEQLERLRPKYSEQMYDVLQEFLSRTELAGKETARIKRELNISESEDSVEKPIMLEEFLKLTNMASSEDLKRREERLEREREKTKLAIEFKGKENDVDFWKNKLQNAVNLQEISDEGVKLKKTQENEEIRNEISQINFYESRWLKAYDSMFKESQSDSKKKSKVK
eukprot:765565-Hanusia_phi.AAC.1